MKKTAKLFTLLLAVVTLFCVFAFAVNADTAEKPWDPAKDTTKDYTGITYGVWATEQDYLDGKAPHHFSIGNLVSAEVGISGANDITYKYKNDDDSFFIPGYVHVFKDLATDDIITVGMAQKLKINLGTHKLTDNKGFLLGKLSASRPDTSLTIVNGTIDGVAGKFQTRDDATLIFEDVTINHNHTQFVQGGAQLVRFTDCTVTINNAKAVFDLSAANGGRTQNLEFINTDLIYTVQVNNSQTGSGKYFIRILEAANEGKDAKWNILFDKNSSLRMPEGADFGWLMTEDASASSKFVNNQNIYVEEGFRISTSELSGKFAHKAYDGSTKQAAVEYNFGGKPNGSSFGVNFYVVKPGTKTSVDNFCLSTQFNPYNTKKSGFYMVTGYTGNAWVPDTSYEGITYASWASEADYKNGMTPVFWFKDTVLTGANIASTSEHGNAFADNEFMPAYVHVFAQELTIDSMIYTGQLQKLTVNLNNAVVNDNAGIRVGGGYTANTLNAEFTMKNGTVNAASNVLYVFRAGSTVKFDHVEFNITRSGELALANDNGARLVEYSNCIINLKNATAGITKTTGVHYPSPNELRFVNTDIIQTETNENSPLIYITNNGTSSQTTVTFDKDSSVVRNNNYYVCINPTNNDTTKQTVVYELGFSAGYNAIPDLSYSVGTPNSDNYVKYTDNGYANVSFVKAGEKLDEYYFVANGDLYTLTDVAPAAPSIPADALQANLTLYTTFVLNLHADPEYIKGIALGDKALKYVVVNGKNVYSVENIDPTDTTEALNFVITFTDDTTYNLEYSVLAYANRAIEDTNVSTLGKELVSAAMAYANAVCDYADKETFDFTGVTYTEAEIAEPDAVSSDVIASAQLLIVNGKIKYVFNLNDVTADIIVAGTSYEVIGGVVADVDYIIVEARAFELLNGVKITENGVTYTYTLANYAYTAQNDAEAGELVQALYTYAKYAYEYKVANKNLD